jgi:hypothetical protein
MSKNIITVELRGWRGIAPDGTNIFTLYTRKNLEKAQGKKEDRAQDVVDQFREAKVLITSP